MIFQKWKKINVLNISKSLIPQRKKPWKFKVNKLKNAHILENAHPEY